MRAEIVMIGSELLLGEIVDTNANLLARMLRDIGLDLYYKTTVGDNEGRITEVLNQALDRSDVVITSGGLGPTVDDLTRQAVANATGRELVYSPELEAQIAARFRSFGRPMAENNKRQAYIPEGALPLPNPVGTAPLFSQRGRARPWIYRVGTGRATRAGVYDDPHGHPAAGGADGRGQGVQNAHLAHLRRG